MLKFSGSLRDYPFVLSFDLAKNVAGWSLVDTRDNTYTVLDCDIIDMSKYSKEDFWLEYKKRLIDVFVRTRYELHTRGFDDAVILVTKEKLPSQAGVTSTIATLQALAKVHAVFELALDEMIARDPLRTLFLPYDKTCPCGVEHKETENGVHAASVKALFRKIIGIDKPTKQDIREAVSKICRGKDVSSLKEDISDSIAVTITLKEVKFNADIDEERKALRKKIRSLKSENAKVPYAEELKRLESLKLPPSKYEKV